MEKLQFLHWIWIPSDKLSQNYGKWQFLMGKSTISMAIFNSYVTNYQRVHWSFPISINPHKAPRNLHKPYHFLATYPPFQAAQQPGRGSCGHPQPGR
jgi:hypothetical protein